MLLKWGLFACVASLPTNVSAQVVRLVMVPEAGVESSTSTGGELFSYARNYTVDGAALMASAKAGDWLLEDTYAAGTVLIPVSTKAKFKACAPYANTLTAGGPCFLDDDGDGRFDRQAKDEITGARKLKPPVPYTKQPVSLMGKDSFRYTILYQGATSDTVRFSYREFKDDMARPAFTEELTIPREPFPQMAMLKNIQVEILGLTGMGLKYRIVKVNGL